MTGTEASNGLGFSAAATRSVTWATRLATEEVEDVELRRRRAGARFEAREVRVMGRRVEMMRGIAAIVAVVLGFLCVAWCGRRRIEDAGGLCSCWCCWRWK
jgi:hypothetical protein